MTDLRCRDRYNQLPWHPLHPNAPLDTRPRTRRVSQRVNSQNDPRHRECRSRIQAHCRSRKDKASTCHRQCQGCTCNQQGTAHCRRWLSTWAWHRNGLRHTKCTPRRLPYCIFQGGTRLRRAVWLLLHKRIQRCSWSRPWSPGRRIGQGSKVPHTEGQFLSPSPPTAQSSPHYSRRTECCHSHRIFPRDM